jgi:hypothetical protein
MVRWSIMGDLKIANLIVQPKSYIYAQGPEKSREMSFGTVINCIDGRVQIPVLEYLRTHFSQEYFDACDDAGPLKTLTDRKDRCRLNSLKEQIRVSLEVHGSRLIAVVGHHDSAGNPLPGEEQEVQICRALKYLRAAFGKDIMYLGLYVDDQWMVREVHRLEPNTPMG